MERDGVELTIPKSNNGEWMHTTQVEAYADTQLSPNWGWRELFRPDPNVDEEILDMSERVPCPIRGCGQQPIYRNATGLWACNAASHALLGPVNDPSGSGWDDMASGQTPQPPTWRGRTCGECGWAMVWRTGLSSICRRHAWLIGDCNLGGEVEDCTPACPSFVAREEQC